MTVTAGVLPRDVIAINGGGGTTNFAIERTYAEGASYQWAVELLRNIIQVHERMLATGDPNATKVEGWIDFILVSIQDQATNDVVAEPYKRCVWNIGTPMTPSELGTIYSSLNVGVGENRWSLENMDGSYGMGARAATLPFTDLLITTVIPGEGIFGIVLGSVKVANSDGSITTHYTVKRPVFYYDGKTPSLTDPLFRLDDPDAVAYLRTEHGTEIELTEALVPEKLRASEVGGMSFLFLGKGDYTSPTEYDPSPRKGESGRPTPNVLTNRFVGNGVPFSVKYMFGNRTATGSRTHSPHLAASDGTQWYYDTRVLKTLSDWTSRAVAMDPVYLDAHGTTATAYLLPEDYWHTGSHTDAQKDAYLAANPGAKFEYRSDGTWGLIGASRDEWLPFSGKGQVVVRYGAHEMYVLNEGTGRSADVLKRWGISEERVARSVLIVITPPVQETHDSDGWGITQNAARSNISGPNGSDLPVADWQNVWLDHFPKPIQERLQVRPPSVSRDIPAEDIKRLEHRAFGKATKANPMPPVTVVATGKERKTAEGEETEGETTTSAGSGKKPSPTPSNRPASKQSQNAEEKPGGSKRVTRRRPRRPEPPQPVFLDARQWADSGYDPEQFCRVSAMGDSYKIELNSGHEVMNRQVAFYWDDLLGGHFSKATTLKTREKILRKHGGTRTAGADAKAKSAAVTEIEYVYRYDALATFIGAEAVFTDRAGVLDRAAFNEHVCDESMALTVALAGYYPQAEAIKSRLNGLAA